MLPTRPGWILLMRKKFERSEQALGVHSRGQVEAKRGYAGHESAMFSPPQSAELCDMGGFVMDLLDAPRIIGAARWIDRLTRCLGP